MCRMCLVEVDSGRGPQLTPSCMVTVAPDMKVDTESATTKRAQEGILELLLANHPLDCPVCDKGGECPLQDQAFSHGPGESRYVEEKRHFEKPIPISDLVLLDRERCILCDRCTRFADEVAGDPLISFTQRGNQTQVMTFPDEPFSSYFSGNTVQICPVGALTATPYRFKARPWDLEQVESTCTTCSVGCRIVVQSSRDELVRYLGVDSDPVNWGWLCDRGRFNFEATASPDRLAAPLVRGEGGLAATSWNVAMTAAAQLVREALDGGGPGEHRRARRRPRHERGRLRLGRARRRPRHRRTATPSSPTGCRPQCSACPGRRSTRRRGEPRSSCSRPDLKEELPVLLPAPAPRRRAAQGASIIELGPVATGLTPPRLAQRPRRGRRGRRRRRPRSPTTRSPTSSPPVRSSSSPGGPTSPSRRAPPPPRCAPCSTPARAPRCCPALRRGNVVGAAPARPDAARRRARRDRHPHRRRRGPHRPARAARRRPARRLSPTPTWPAAPSPAPAG